MISLTKLVAWVMAAGLQISGNTTPMPPKLAHGIATMSMAYPLFSGEDGELQTAAFLTDFAWHESGFRNHLIAKEADGGNSYGAFMIRNCEPYTCYEIINDEQKSSYVALKWMARSMHYCDEYPYWLSIYASGTCHNAAGRAISKKRIQEAEQLAKTVKVNGD
jgi:hypothetical protein